MTTRLSTWLTRLGSRLSLLTESRGSSLALSSGTRIPRIAGLSLSCRTAGASLLTAADDLLDIIRGHMQRQEFHLALTEQWRVIALANRYVDAQAPWTLRKTDPARMATVLYVLAEVIRRLAVLAQPVMPGAAGRMLDQLGVAEDARRFTNLGGDSALAPATPLPKPEGVFPRYVEEEST